MKGSLYTIVYAACVGTCCATLLTGVAEITRPYREANQRADELRNILEVLEVPFARRATAAELIAIYEQHVQREERGPLVVYRRTGLQGETGSVAVELSGAGAWGPVRGFLALGDDWSTIRDITFHDHQETPGLGGEISQEPFRRQFRGKQLFDENLSPAFRIVRDGADSLTEVDAISGATITCNRIESILRDVSGMIADAREKEAHP